MARKGNQGADALVDSAIRKVDEGNMRGAISDCNEALKLDPTNTRALCNRGIANYYIRRLDDAIIDLEQVISQNNNYPKATYYLGLSYLEIQRYEEAINNFNKVKKNRLYKANAYIGLAKAKASQKEFEKALEDARKAARLDPSNEAYKATLAELRRQKDDEESLEMQVKTIRDIERAKQQEEKRYRSSSRIRLILVFYFGIVLLYAVVLFMPWEGGFMARLVPWESTELSYLSLLRSISVTSALTAPFIILYRIYSRNAEEAKVLVYDFQRMILAENRIKIVFESDPEQQKVLYKQLIQEWLADGPVETLLRMKKRYNDTADITIAEDIMEKIRHIPPNKQ